MTPSYDLVVTTEHGPVRGLRSGGVRTWRAIPYAAPPVRELRWSAPQPAKPWHDVRDCTRFGPRSIQPITPTWPGAVPVDDPVHYSEDSLLLNVSVPDGSPPSDGWPVLFYVHGGGFMTGSPVELNEGQTWVRAGIALVSIQYRLGPLGFLDLSCLDPDESASGVAGLLDQIAALGWTRRNVAAFGGNPDQITIYGGSAGAKSVAFLMASPLAAGTAQRAIMCSGAGNLVKTAGMAAEQTDLFLQAVNRNRDVPVTTVAQLRDVAPTDLLRASTELLPTGRDTWLWRPSLHRDVLPRPPVEAIRAGAAADVDLLLGVCYREGELFAAGENLPHVLDGARTNLELIVGAGRADAVIDAYRSTRPGISTQDATVAAFGDALYGIPTLRLADAQSRHASVWRYRLDVSIPGLSSAGLPRAHHGAEATILWGVRIPDGYPGFTFEENAADISETCDQFTAAVISFVATGTPSTASLDWPSYDADKRATLIVDAPIRVEHDPHPVERAVWGDGDWIAGTWYPVR